MVQNAVDHDGHLFVSLLGDERIVGFVKVEHGKARRLSLRGTESWKEVQQ